MSHIAILQPFLNLFFTARVPIISLSYHPSPIAYKVYCNNVLIHTINHGPAPETFFVESNGESIWSFTMTAVIDSTGAETPHSSPYLLTVVETPSPPTGFRLGSYGSNNKIESYSQDTLFSFCKNIFDENSENFIFARKMTLPL